MLIISVIVCVCDWWRQWRRSAVEFSVWTWWRLGGRHCSKHSPAGFAVSSVGDAANLRTVDSDTDTVRNNFGFSIIDHNLIYSSAEAWRWWLLPPSDRLGCILYADLISSKPLLVHVTVSSFIAYSILHWSVAVSTICHQSSRVVAFLQAVARPKFRGPRAASIARSQVWLGLLIGRFQSGSTCRIAAVRAR